MKQTATSSGEKFVTLFNFTGNIYDVPYTSGRFQRVLIQTTRIDVQQGELSDNQGSIKKQWPLNRASFDAIFKESSCVVIHDSMFLRESFLVETEEFFDNGGLEALVAYFRRGGTIMVDVVEGIYAIGDILSTKFGCRWKLQSIESSEVALTERGRQLLGSDIPSSMTLQGKPHFMRAPRIEALISKKVYTREEFEKIYAPDSEDEDAFLRYKREEEGQYVMCVYEGFGSEGRLIWNGDRGKNPAMKAVFQKLVNL